ncbi:MAG: helix-turn-helix transcriptional regulator [Acidobacteriota bacterium]
MALCLAASKLTRAAFARYAGVSPPAVHEWLSGRQPRVDKIGCLLDLGLTLDAIETNVVTPQALPGILDEARRFGIRLREGSQP